MTSYATGWWARSSRRTTSSTRASLRNGHERAQRANQAAERPSCLVRARSEASTRMSIEVLNESGLDLDVRRTQKLARFVMDRMRVHPQADLCVTAVDAETIAELNQKWMEKEGPTDVLAFPMDELRPGHVNEEPEEGVLG